VLFRSSPIANQAAIVMRYPRILLATATIACLLPWVNRAVFVDDTLFLWSAKRILSTPADFYGGTANWGGTTDRFVDVVMNPPLASYYLAAIAGMVGFREVPLHAAMMVPAVATILGTYELARRVSNRPLLAAAALLCSPVFLLCSITLMCDITMLALWVWSLALWLRGLDRNEHWSMALGSLLIGLCGLAKYFGIALLPLVLLYGCARQRRLGARRCSANRAAARRPRYPIRGSDLARLATADLPGTGPSAVTIALLV